MTDIHRFPCENCGADYRYDPGKGQLICDHCGQVSEISDSGQGPWGDSSATAIRELDYKAALAERLKDTDLEETQVLSCDSCGAQVEFDPGIHADVCPFCASPVVSGTGTNRHIKPAALLPFILSEKEGKKSMNDWLGRLWFAPSGLKEFARKGRRMEGVYVPYWTFDAQTKSSYTGQRGTVYYESRTVTRNGKRMTEQVQKVRWRNASGRVARFFDDVLVLASRSLPTKFTQALAPWDLSALQPYAPEFVAGLRAEAYMIEIDEAFQTARAQMDRVIERDVRFDIGGDRQRIQGINTSISDVTFKHVLLPIWVAAYKYNGKSYRFVINGQTGRVQGERPYSAWKIAIAVVLGAILLAAVGYMIALGQNAPYPGTY